MAGEDQLMRLAEAAVQLVRQLVQRPAHGVAQGRKKIRFCRWGLVGREVASGDLIPGEFDGLEGLTAGVRGCYACVCHGSDSLGLRAVAWVSWC